MNTIRRCMVEVISACSYRKTELNLKFARPICRGIIL
jgi:hypothetical protein